MGEGDGIVKGVVEGGEEKGEGAERKPGQGREGGNEEGGRTFFFSFPQSIILPSPLPFRMVKVDSRKIQEEK